MTVVEVAGLVVAVLAMISILAASLYLLTRAVDDSAATDTKESAS